MLPYLREDFGNPASTTHAFGWTAGAAGDPAREEVAVVTDGVDQRRGPRGLPQKRRIAGRPRSAGDPGERFGGAEELTPGLIHRRRITTVGFVRLGDVAVVEDGRRRRKGAHSLKL